MSLLEKYFQEQVSLPETPDSQESMTVSEKDFLNKYFNEDSFAGALETKAEESISLNPEHLQESGIAAKFAENNLTPKADLAPSAKEAEVTLSESSTLPRMPGSLPLVKTEEREDELACVALEKQIAQATELQLAGFYIAGQEFAFPIEVVQEVIRSVEITRLPLSHAYIIGVFDLRGQVTILADTGRLLSLAEAKEIDYNFIMVCRIGKLQIGLLVESISSLYKVTAEDVEWSFDVKMGIPAAMTLGLLKKEGRLIKILSVARIADDIMMEEHRLEV